MKIMNRLDQLAACILVVGCLTLIGLGIDSEVKSILTIAAGYLFATEARRKRRNNR